MGLFGFLKKKEKSDVPLPPGKIPQPPKKADLPGFKEDFPIPEGKKDIPEIPSMTEIEGTISSSKAEEAFELPELPEMKAQPKMEEIKAAIEEEKEPTHLEFPEKLSIPSAEERLPPMEELPALEKVPEHIPELGETKPPSFKIEEKIGPAPIEPTPVRPKLKEISEPVTRKKGGPIFVETHEFTNIMKEIEIMKSDLKKADNTISGLNDLKNKQETRFEKLRSSMENIERKLIYVDDIVFEKG